jgi:hypothetical protein
MSIVLHIERLALDQTLLGDEHASAVRLAIERELSLRLQQPDAVDVLRSMGSLTALPAGALPAATYPHERLGSRIATAVQGSLGIRQEPRR